MKRITFLIAFVLLASFVFGQSNVLQSSEIGGRVKADRDMLSYKTPTDTIFIDDFFAALVNAYNYTAPGYGYIFGPHWDTAGVARSVEQAQGFLNLGAGYGVEGCLIWTAYKYTSGAGSELYVRCCLKDGTSSYTIGGTPYNISCPGNATLAADTLTWAEIDTSSTAWTTAVFSTPAYIPAATDFCIVYNVSDFYTNGDTLSIIGGDPVATATYGLEYTWYRYPNPNLWAQFSHLWTSGGNPIEAAIAIFPIVDENYGNIGDAGYINYMQMSQNFPNPSNGTTSITYAIENDATVIFELYDSKGNKVVDLQEGCKPAGTYTINLDQDLAAGIYYYSLVANGFRLTKKMTIE
jgi:hypothetical protein